ncbi:MAG TPA: DUF6272 family protein [Polyangiaceae bacterium]|nr:DUF6272 family protein [Polyangiaceae bacterium]
MKLRREQNAVNDARRFAELAVSYCNAEAKQAIAMAVSEFAENLLKYGSSEGDAGAGVIGIGVEHNTIRVRATNDVVSSEDARRVQDVVQKISASPNVKDLYRSRLRELFENPTLPRAQLGLLRVAFEGGFKLSCAFEASRLEIVAERQCGKAP